MKISIGADHRGFNHKDVIIKSIESIDWIDLGCFSTQRCDYPEFAQLVAKSILNKETDLGVLLCGSGIGMAIAANRFKNIYAGLCWSKEVAKVAKQHDNINILVLPTDFVTPEESIEIINAWLGADFKSGHYQKRLDMIDRLT